MRSKKEFDEKDLEKRSKELLGKIKDESLEASPYLSTRVLAELEERKKHHAVVFWRRTAIASLASLAGLILIVVFMFNTGRSFDAYVDQPLLVKVDVKDIKEYKVAYAKVDLPEGVAFYSKVHPDVVALKTLTLFNDPSTGKLPFVIRSNEKGIKEVKVTFYDDNDNVVFEKKLNINFVNHG